MEFGFANVASITAICYVIGMVIGTSPIDNKWIPTIVAIVGAILGVVGFYVGIPDFPATEPVTAAAVGIASGAAATWANQQVKQIKTKPVVEENTTEE